MDIELPIRLHSSSDVLSPTDFANFIIDNLHPYCDDFPERILDLGTGSGILAITMARFGCKRIDATDLNQRAIIIAKINARMNNVINQISFIASDLFENIVGNKYDLITCNPPTFSSTKANLKMSPLELAFFCSGPGFTFLERLFSQVANMLTDKGHLLTLIPSYHPVDYLLNLLEINGMQANIHAEKTVPWYEYLSETGKLGINTMLLASDCCGESLYQHRQKEDHFRLYLIDAMRF